MHTIVYAKNIANKRKRFIINNIRTFATAIEGNQNSTTILSKMYVSNHKSDVARASINKGKTTNILAYSRQRLTNMGIPLEYMARVISPQGAFFSFEKRDTPVSITPIEEIPNLLVREMVSKLAKMGAIEPGGCYGNALLLACRLNRAGVPVRCVEGYYNPYGHWCKHRFNEIDGLFFDATAELYANAPLSSIQYQSIRIYSFMELYAITAAFSFLKNKPFGLYTSSTLPYNPKYQNPLDEIGDYFNEYCLNDSGVVCKNTIK